MSPRVQWQGKKLPLIRPSKTSTLVSQTSGFPKALVVWECMKMTTAFETRLHEHLNKAITIVASFVIITEVIKPFNVFAVSLTV